MRVRVLLRPIPNRHTLLVLGEEELQQAAEPAEPAVPEPGAAGG